MAICLSNSARAESILSPPPPSVFLSDRTAFAISRAAWEMLAAYCSSITRATACTVSQSMGPVKHSKTDESVDSSGRTGSSEKRWRPPSRKKLSDMELRQLFDGWFGGRVRTAPRDGKGPYCSSAALQAKRTNVVGFETTSDS